MLFPAIVALTAHVPLASVTERVPPVTEQPVEAPALNVTVPAVVPPVVLSAAVLPNVTGLGVATAVRAAWPALLMVKLAVPLRAAKPESPAKLAPTPDGYEPAPIPDKLAFDNVAVPDALVDAAPTGLPFSVKLIDLPLTPAPLAVRVADTVAVPPYVPDAVATASDVFAPALAASAKF